MKFLWLLMLLIGSFSPIGATSIDSLQTLLIAAVDSEKKVDLYDDIANHYLITNVDSSVFFSKEGLSLARLINYQKGIVRCLSVLGNYYERKTRYEEAMECYGEALDIAKAEQDTPSLAIVINNIAIIYIRKGDYKKAIELNFDVLKMEESLGNQKGIAESYNNIGVIYFYQRQMDKTITYFEKSIAIEEELNDPSILKKGYNNLGAICDYTGEHQKALVYYRKSYELSKKLDDENEMALNLHNIAVAYHNLDSLSLSEAYHKSSIALRKKLGDRRGIAHSYSNFAGLYKSQKEWEKAKLLYEKSLAIALDAPYKEIEIEVYKSMADLYEQQDDFESANEYLTQYITGRDSFINEKNNEAIAEIESKYETAKREKEILEQSVELAAKNQAIAYKNRQLLGASSILVVLFLLGLVLYQRNQQLKKQYALEQAQTVVKTQQKLEEQRLQIARDLHDNIGAQLTFLISTIGNLQYLFRKKEEPLLLEKLSGMNVFVKQTIQELRDTIWAMNKKMIRLADLEERIRQYVEKAKEAAPQLSFEVEWQVGIEKEQVLNPVEGMNVYRVIQEAINNAIKYANGTIIRLQIEIIGEHISYLVKDNGVGFEMNQGKGNGLHNMQKRAAEIGAQLCIESRAGEGTYISLQMPLSNQIL
jgi:signal transduction histidine kinase